MTISMPHPYGDYVVPYDMGPDGPPKGFIHDGDSFVADLDHETAARHDWDYFIGVGKLAADWRYTWGYIKDQRPVRAIVRLLGLSVFGHIPYRHHRRRMKEVGLDSLLEERMIHYAAGDYWDWAHKDIQKSWLIEDLRRNV